MQFWAFVGFRVWGLGFGVEGLGLRVWGYGLGFIGFCRVLWDFLRVLEVLGFSRVLQGFIDMDLWGCIVWGLRTPPPPPKKKREETQHNPQNGNTTLRLKTPQQIEN